MRTASLAIEDQPEGREHLRQVVAPVELTEQREFQHETENGRPRHPGAQTDPE
jgi:hypothetical protein